MTSRAASITAGAISVGMLLVLAVDGLLPLSTTHAAAAEATELKGAYISTDKHPRVLMSPDDLKSLVGRVETKNSFTKQMFGRLAAQANADVQSNVDWSAVYSGCDLDTYLRMYSIESTGGYANELRSDDELSKTSGAVAGKGPPHGAAVVAARLALYAALVRAGATPPAGAPSAEAAADLSRKILLAWAMHGFRNASGGEWLNEAAQFCKQGKPDKATQTAVGLQVARGVIYSVFAQDLLDSFGGLDAEAAKMIDAFHKAMFDLIVNAHNFDFSDESAWHEDCERYSNHVAMQLAALLAISRSLNDEHRFNAALKGSDTNYHLATPWLTLFNRIIYGENDVPNACYPNVTANGAPNKNSFNTSEVFPGEIDDRYRAANSHQAFGYAFATLNHLYAAAEILRVAGYDAYRYHGPKGQSIQTATAFYACYVRAVGFGKVVKEQNARRCRNFAQYEGKTVSGAATPTVIGAIRYPNDGALTGLASAAESTQQVDLSEPLLFGRWPDR